MVGIDIVEIARIEQMMEKNGERFLARFLCDEEIALVHASQSIAGFYAAKEAVAKALGCGIGKECGFFDIRLHKDEKGAPWFTLSRNVAEKFGITETALSITHDGGFAVAAAILKTTRTSGKKVCH